MKKLIVVQWYRIRLFQQNAGGFLGIIMMAIGFSETFMKYLKISISPVLFGLLSVMAIFVIFWVGGYIMDKLSYVQQETTIMLDRNPEWLKLYKMVEKLSRGKDL